MMKSTVMPAGTSVAVAAMALASASVSFLLLRENFIRLTPVGAPGAAYAWRRVFRKGGRERRI